MPLTGADTAGEAWQDEANWTSIFGHRVIYSAPSDARILVPKQPLEFGGVGISLGWTLNMAHATSKFAIGALVLCIPVIHRVYRKR